MPTSRFSRRLLSLVAALALAGCVPDRCNTPFGEGAIINIREAQYAELMNVGGALAINRGHRGIVITRVGFSQFVAFELACPADHDVALDSIAGWGYSMLQCPVCASRFYAQTGLPLDGSSTYCPLYEYSTSFDGAMLEIY